MDSFNSPEQLGYNLESDIVLTPGIQSLTEEIILLRCTKFIYSIYIKNQAKLSMLEEEYRAVCCFMPGQHHDQAEMYEYILQDYVSQDSITAEHSILHAAQFHLGIIKSIIKARADLRRLFGMECFGLEPWIMSNGCMDVQQSFHIMMLVHINKDKVRDIVQQMQVHGVDWEVQLLVFLTFGIKLDAIFPFLFAEQGHVQGNWHGCRGSSGFGGGLGVGFGTSAPIM